MSLQDSEELEVETAEISQFWKDLESTINSLPSSISHLETILETAPFEAAIYPLVINQFRVSNDIGNTRRFRSLYSLVCVVDDDFWLQWIDDEKKAMTLMNGLSSHFKKAANAVATAEQSSLPPVKGGGITIRDTAPRQNENGSIASLHENTDAISDTSTAQDTTNRNSSAIINTAEADGGVDETADVLLNYLSALEPGKIADAWEDYTVCIPHIQLINSPSLYKPPYPPFDDTPLDINGICLLYELAIKCCCTVEIWLHYIHFLIARTAADGDIQYIRTTFETAIKSLGLHALDGPKIWTAYRAFECKRLEAISDAHLLTEQIDRIRRLFYRQLKLPLGGLQDLLDEYRVWEEDLPENLKVSFQKAEESHQIGHNEWEKRKIFEMRAQSEMDDLGDIHGLNTLWNDYLSFELSTKDPARICITYMRALEDLGSIREDLWLSFTDYMTDTLNDTAAALLVYSNSVKHFPACSKLWVNYLLSMCDFAEDLKEIYEVCFRGLKGCNNDVLDTIDIYLTAADCIRRHIEKKSLQKGEPTTIVDWSPVRGMFQLAEKYAESVNADETLVKKIWHHWARFETGTKDMLVFVKVCEKMLVRFGTLFEVWMNYIHFMKQLLVDKEHVYVYTCLSALFQRALKSVEDYPLALKQEWIQFEYEMGSARSIRLARKAVASNELFSRSFLHRSTRTTTASNRSKGTMSVSSESSNNNSESELYPNEIAKDPRKEIVCLSSIRNRRDKRRRKGDGDPETSSEASSDSGFGTAYKKSRPSLYRETVPPAPTPPPPLPTDTGGLFSGPPYTHTRSTLDPSRLPLHAVGMALMKYPPLSPKSSPASATSSRSRSPSPLRISPRSRSPSPPKSLLPLSATNSSVAPLSSAEVERYTRATWDGYESIDPSIAPKIPPHTEITTSPLHTPITAPPIPFPLTPLNHNHSLSASKTSSSSHTLPSTSTVNSDNTLYFSDMPPPPYTPRRPRSTAYTHTAALTGSKGDGHTFTENEGNPPPSFHLDPTQTPDTFPHHEDYTTTTEWSVEPSSTHETLHCTPTSMAVTHTRDKSPIRGNHHLQKLLSSTEEFEDYLGVTEEPSTIWVSNIDATVTEKDLVDLFCSFEGYKEVRLVKDYKQISRGFAYIEFSSPANAAAAAQNMNGFIVNDRALKALISKPTKVLYEPNTVFISNLPSNATVKHVRTAIESCGFVDVKDIRLKQDEEHNCVGYGYVEFEEGASVAALLKMDGQLVIEDTPVKIAPSIPMKERHHPSAPSNKRLLKAENEQKQIPTPDPLTVHVKNLAFAVDDEVLTKHFEMIGEVEATMICRYPDGKSRGFAFVKFRSEADCFAALMLNGSELCNRSIVVSRSTREMTVPKHDKTRNTKHRRDSVHSQKPSIPKLASRIRIENVESMYKRQDQADKMHVDEEGDTQAGNMSLDMSKTEGSSHYDTHPKTNEEFRELFLAGKL